MEYIRPYIDRKTKLYALLRHIAMYPILDIVIVDTILSTYGS
jgi:hypothetical protein